MEQVRLSEMRQFLLPAKARWFGVLLLFILGQPIHAQKSFTLDRTLPGAKMLGLSLKDSLEGFDISNMSVEGYEIENAIYYQQNDPLLPLILKSNVLDISHNSDFTVISFDRNQGFIEISVPMDFVWPDAGILVDSSFGGFSQKILSYTELEYLGGYKKWGLQTKSAGIKDIVEQCDISFKSQPRTQLDPRDYFWEGAVVGESPLAEGPRWVEGHLKTHARDVSFSIKPNIEGHLKVVAGEIVLSELSLIGAFEAKALVTAESNTFGKFNHQMRMPLNINHALPLDSGLILSISEGLTLNFNVESHSQGFRSESELKALGEFQLVLNYNTVEGWTVTNQQINITPLYLKTPFSRENYFAKGFLDVSVSANITSKWFGEFGVELTADANSKMQQDSSNVYGMDRKLSYTLAFKGKGTGFNAAETTPAPQFSIGQITKEVLKPPVALERLESPYISQDSAVLSWFGSPGANGFLLQKNSSGVWENVDTVQSVRYSLNGLAPNSLYRYRVIPLNNLGAGLPTELQIQTLPQNRPPSLPQVAFPALNDTIWESNIHLKWESADPDLNDVLSYTVYLDTVADPVSKILENNPDKEFNFQDLIPGKRYFIKIMASDGIHNVLSPVWSFYSAPVEKPKIIETKLKQLPNSVLIPEGRFQRGDGKLINISSFYLQKFEVIQKDFESSAGYNPSYWKGDSLPVENVNWDQAFKYCSDMGGRLPTEAEWEYAARGASRTEFYWGQNNIKDYAWYYANSEKRSHKVGKKKPNGFGLYDMSGNVFEWVMDWYGEYSSEKIENPLGPKFGTKRVTRGGSWYSDARSLKSSSRFMNRPGFASFKLGFRCAFDVD